MATANQETVEISAADGRRDYPDFQAGGSRDGSGNQQRWDGRGRRDQVERKGLWWKKRHEPSLPWLRNKLLGNISSLAASEGFLRKIWSEHTTGKGCEEGVVNNPQPILKMARSHSKYCL